ncbi:MAG: RNA polymerase factor sigma-54 [Paramuribaculum sp.]
MSSPSSPRQSLGQVQGLRQQQTLAPQQVLFLRLLGLNTLELEDEVQRTLEENPALEAVDDMPDPDAEELESKLPPRESYDDGDTFDESAEHLQLSDFQRAEDVPFAGPDELIDSFMASSGRTDPALRARESADSTIGTSVMEHLESQIAELPLDEQQRIIASHIAGNIDDNGYLCATLRQIADDLAINDGIEVTTAEVNTVFEAMRTLDPPGICAVDLRDCLLLQLRRRELTDRSPAVATAREMVADFFDLFSKRHFDRLCSAMSITRDELKKAAEIVKSLHPKPGALISGSRVDDLTNQITPDFIIDTDGSTIDLQMTNSIPALKVESSFDIDDAALPARRRGSADAQAFIRTRRDDAAAYIHAIDLRRQTLYRIMRAIIHLQRDFFLSEGDPSTLRPMILKNVSSITGDDISVVSRATAGKYVATRYGTYPLKFFFNEAPSAESADSSIKIIETLRSIVADEDPSDPLSDEALTAMLHQLGYKIARRTVAKYREKASIPVARLRRRLD